LGSEYRDAGEFFVGGKLSCCRERWLGFLVEESDQAFDVLGGRGQEELLTNKLHSTQAQATQSDLILELREQCFHLLSLPLCVREARRVGQVSRVLPGRFMHVDGKILQR
jgi:hypothetical protein